MENVYLFFSKKSPFYSLVFLSLFFIPEAAFSQCAKDLVRPNIYPEEYYYQDYNRAGWAFSTNGTDPSALYVWSADPLVNTIPWVVCQVGNNGDGPGNPPDPTADKNDVFIQINANDSVTVERILLKNNATLVVCGYLKVEEDFIVGDPNNTFNNGKVVVCPGGVLVMDVFNVKNNTTVVVDGTFIVNEINGQQENNNCIYGTGTIVNHNGGAPYIGEDITNFQFGTGQLDCTLGAPPEGGVILPVNLLTFTSEVKPDRIHLNWTTGSEINNDYFTLERSRDLYGWEVLGYAEGAGNSSVPLDYSFTDYQPLDGLVYYRLKQTDFDGKSKYFGPIAAHYDLGLGGLEFKVMKNFSNWIIALPNGSAYQVEVYNLQGHRLHSEKVENNLSIPAPQGAVVIRVTDGFERSASRVVL